MGGYTDECDAMRVWKNGIFKGYDICHKEIAIACTSPAKYLDTSFPDAIVLQPKNNS